MAVAKGCARNAGDDAEDRAQAVIDAVNRVADPAGGLPARVLAFGQQIIKQRLRIGTAFLDGAAGIMLPDQRAELVIMLAFFLNDLVQNFEALGIVKLAKLATVESNGAAFVDFESAERHTLAAHAIGETIGVTGGLAVILRHRCAQLANARGPLCRMLLLSLSHAAQSMATDWVRVPLGEREVGVEPAHFRLPVVFERAQQFPPPLVLCLAGLHGYSSVSNLVGESESSNLNDGAVGRRPDPEGLDALDGRIQACFNRTKLAAGGGFVEPYVERVILMVPADEVGARRKIEVANVERDLGQEEVRILAVGG